MKKRIIISFFVLTSLALSGCAGIDQTTDTATVSPQDLINLSDIQDTTKAEVTDISYEVEPALFEINETIDDYEEQIISLYKAASPSVVNITSVAYVFNHMLGQLTEEGVGTGFVYDTQGHIVTNYHVIEGADELIVTLSTGEKLTAEVIGVDETNDLAVLSIDAGQNLPTPLPLADSDLVEVGETVLAIGNPYGLEWTLTTGVVSALGRVIQSSQEGEYIAEAIQTDAAINPGNSGGPLVNMEGQVIGITSQIISASGSSSGLGFAVSSNTVQRIVPEIIANGRYLHPWLGLEMVDLTDYSIAILEEAGMFVPVESGVLVVGVEWGSPTEDADIRAGERGMRFGPYVIPVGGDILTAINDVPIESQQDLMVYLETQTNIGDTVMLSIIRDGKEQSVSVTLTAEPAYH